RKWLSHRKTMAQPELTEADSDFETQLATLVVEAARSQQSSHDDWAHEKKPAPPAPAPAPTPAPAPAATPANLLQMLKPMVLGIEALSRAVTEHSATIGKIETTLAAQAMLPELMKQIQETLDRK